MLDAALTWWEVGYNVIPINQSKVPQGEWRKWQKVRQTKEDVQQMNWSYGVAIITGFCGVEAIDIDVKNDPTGNVAKDYFNILKEEPYCYITDFFAQKTPSGGAHIVYRRDDPQPNQPIAKVNSRAIIETRGDGGILAVHPTPGYELFKSRAIGKLQSEEVIALWEIAKGFGEAKPEKAPVEYSEEKPWEAFNRAHSKDYVLGILSSHGWEIVYENAPRTFLRRPGKDKGVSADYNENLNLFKAFTTSTEFEAGVGYSPFGVLTMLEYGGDFGAAIRGEGLRVTVTPNEDYDPLLDDDVYWFDPNDPIEPVVTTLNYEGLSGKTWKIIGPGMIGTLSGPSKSRKTTVLLNWLASAMTGQPLLGFRWKLNKEEKILWIDTEQEKSWVQANFHKLRKIVGFWPTQLKIAGIRGKSSTKRREFLLASCKRIKPSVLILDGVVDFVRDFNNLQESKDFIDELLWLTKEYGCMIWGVIHINPGQFIKERGHLGTIFQQKS